MDWGHLHLMLNHLPVLGAPALLVLLGWAFARQQPEVVRLALWCTVALGLVTLVVYLTGDSAEEMVEFLPHFDNEMVERHEARSGGDHTHRCQLSAAAMRSGPRVYGAACTVLCSWRCCVDSSPVPRQWRLQRGPEGP